MMKTIKKIFITSLVLLISLGAMAQMKFGVKAGVNLADLAYNLEDSEEEPDTKFKAGFHIGAVASLELSETFGYNTGLIYSQKGVSKELNGEFLGITVNFLV